MNPTTPPVPQPIVPAPTVSPVTPPIVTPPMPDPVSTSTPQSPINNLKTKFHSFPKNVKILIVIIPVFLLLLLLTIVTGLGGRVRNSILPTPTPVPTGTPTTPEITNPSAYATDPELLDLESKLVEFDKNVSQIDLREDTIRPPTVDWDVSFPK